MAGLVQRDETGRIRFVAKIVHPPRTQLMPVIGYRSWRA
jgi:hypothetical protein